MLTRVFSIGLALLSLVACGEKKSEEGAAQPLVVIISPDNPPYEFKDTAQAGDKVIGFDVDVIEKLSEHLGRPIQIVEGDFQSLIPSLQSGRADMAISEIYPTEERRKSVDFSDSYYSNKPALLVLENSTITSEKDFTGGQKIGAQLGTPNETMAQKWTESISGLEVISLNKGGDLVQELKNGRIQAAIMGDNIAHRIAKSTSGLKVITIDTPSRDLAIAFPKGSSLVVPVNEALKNMKGDIEGIAQKWITQ
jgi:ABC-type amino acid transport substrate-binding protein